MKPNYLAKIIIITVLSLLVITAMLYFDEFNDTAIAPYKEFDYFDVSDEIEDTDALLYLPSEIPGTTEPVTEFDTTPEPNGTDPEEYENVYIDPGYVLVTLKPSDISRGNLILINHDNAFTFPQDNENDLVIVYDLLTENVGVTSDNIILSASIIDAFNEMMEGFHAQSNISNVVIRSAFRSMSAQQQIFDGMVRRWGRTGARLWAALPGHSEHHSGFAFDFGISRAGLTEMFEGTGSYVWIPRNSHNFGFILRYPNGKTDITQTNFEPWHYRYVGIPHASIIRSNNWALEEYIENIKIYTFENPLEYTFKSNDIEIKYRIYFTFEPEVRIPYDVEFYISGNNVGGFIVTTWEAADG